MLSTSEEFYSWLRSQAKRKATQKEFIRRSLEKGEIPTSGDIVEEVRRLSFTDAIEVLRHHCGHVLEDKIRSLRTTFRLFEQANADLDRALRSFEAFSNTMEFHWRAYKSKHDQIVEAVRKEIFAFCALAHSLQDHCRRVSELWEPFNTSARLAECLGNDGLHDFICNLRNALHHCSMVEADWHITQT